MASLIDNHWSGQETLSKLLRQREDLVYCGRLDSVSRPVQTTHQKSLRKLFGDDVMMMRCDYATTPGIRVAIQLQKNGLKIRFKNGLKTRLRFLLTILSKRGLISTAIPVLIQLAKKSA